MVYSAGLYGVIPFDMRNSIEIESRNALASIKSNGSAKNQEEWAVYIEANRSISGGFTGGLQLGYKYHKLKEYEDANGTPITDFKGHPLELDLSQFEFRAFIGIRF